MIKISDTVFNRHQINDWDEMTMLQFLPFVSYISLDASRSFDFEDDEILEDLRLLENEDPKLLKKMMHPFQLLESKPLILILSFFPKHLQSLYQQLFLANNPSVLLFPHLLIEFLYYAREFAPCTLRFCILLTILLPTFKRHKMENLLLTFIEQCHTNKEYLKRFNKKASCKAFTKILLASPANYVSSQTTIEDAIEEERRRMSIAANSVDSSSQLYTSSICLAYLIQVLDKETKTPVEAMVEEVLTTAKKIENPLWRLDALLVISRCSDATRFESRDLILELEDLLTTSNNSTSFLGLIALIVRCLSTSKNTFQPKRLFDKIFEQLHLQSENDQQTICETLAQFPLLHVRIHHFIRYKTDWINGDDFEIFNRIFRLHSSKYVTTFFTDNPSLYSYETLLANMYLAELSVDLIKLENWLIQTTPSNQSCMAISELGKTCLHALQRDRSLVSTEIISNLSTYFAYFAESSISPTDEDQEQLQSLECALARRELEDVEAINDFVRKWLHYKTHPFLYHCAHMAAELVALSGIQSSDIIEECCAILISKEYRPCPEVAGRIIRHWQDFDVKFFRIILRYLIREDYAECLPSQLHSELHESLIVESFEEFELLIDAERQKHQTTTENENTSISRWSLFHLIGTWPTDALQYFIDVLLPLKTVTDYPLLTWLLEHIPTKIISESTENERFCEYLLSILNDECICISLKLIVVQHLSYYREDNRVRVILWDIVRKNSKTQTADDDHVTIACLRSLYWKRQVDLEEVELEELKLLCKCSSLSNKVHQAVLTGLYMHIIRESKSYDVFEVYLCYMNNIGDDNDNTFDDDEQDQDGIAQRASDWIICHRSTLLGRFIEDLCKHLNPLLTDLYAYICVADLIGSKIKETLCDAIGESTMGENFFKSSLHLACHTKLTKNNEHIGHCIQVYAYFYEFTCDYASMLLKLKDDCLSRKLFRSISKFKIDREAIDSLLNTIHSTSSSDCERFCAGQFLLKLEEPGYVSIVEIQETIISAIEKYGVENNQSHYDLKRLLFERMSHDLYDPEEHPHTSLYSVAELQVTPSTAAPAIILESS